MHQFTVHIVTYSTNIHQKQSRIAYRSEGLIGYHKMNRAFCLLFSTSALSILHQLDHQSRKRYPHWYPEARNMSDWPGDNLVQRHESRDIFKHVRTHSNTTYGT